MSNKLTWMVIGRLKNITEGDIKITPTGAKLQLLEKNL